MSVTTDIGREFKAITDKVKLALSCVEYCSVTVDMWSDRNIKSYMGVTAHYILAGELKSSLLCVLHFEGSYFISTVHSTLNESTYSTFLNSCFMFISYTSKT